MSLVFIFFVMALVGAFVVFVDAEISGLLEKTGLFWRLMFALGSVAAACVATLAVVSTFKLAGYLLHG